jgi:hypothetical protein
VNGWRNGEEIRYTGETRMLHGGLFYVFVWLTGARKGTEGVTMHAPGNPVIGRPTVKS